MNFLARAPLALLLALSNNACLASDTAWTDKSPHKVGFIRVNGVRLHYLDWGGSGTTLLLLTGLGNTAHIYDDLAPKFADRFHVVGLTWRGHGESEKPEAGYDTATLVEDIRLFLDAMKIQNVSLVGHSLAGDELTMFAANYPHRVEKLVYLDAAYDHTANALLCHFTNSIPLRDLPEVLGSMFPPFPDHDNKSYDASHTRLQNTCRVMTPALEADLRAGTVLHDDGKLEYAMPGRVSQAIIAFAQPNPAYSELKAQALSFYADNIWLDSIPKENRDKATIGFKALTEWRTAERERFRKGMAHAHTVLMPDTSHYCFIQREGEVVREMRAFLLER
jgi:non-heme chloroperoxidase